MGIDLDLRVDRDAGVALVAQLAARIRAALRDGVIGPGARLPSVRELADAAAVNVNTARAVYARLESEGLVRSEQGRGTFAAPGRADAATRDELRREIAQLEAALVRLPPARAAEPPSAAPSGPGAALLSTEDLAAVRDELLERLVALDRERADAAGAAARSSTGSGPRRCPTPEPRRATPSLAGARIRWVGA